MARVLLLLKKTCNYGMLKGLGYCNVSGGQVHGMRRGCVYPTLR